MSKLRSELAGGVYRYAGVPDAPLPDGCPLELVFEVLSDCEDQMLRTYDLSDQNRRIAKVNIKLKKETFTLPTEGSPSYCFLQTDPSSTFWWPVEIVNHSSLNEMRWKGELACSFYGSPAQGEVSWIPDTGQTLRVWYDRTKDQTQVMNGLPEVSALYESHLKLCAAAQVMELCGKDVGPFMLSRIAKGEEQFERFAKSSRQQGAIEKPQNYFPRGQRRRYTEVNRFR